MNYLISRFLPRWFNEWYAAAFGYFWLPCPLCQEYFGGHEWSGYKFDAIYKGKGVWKGICRNCAATNGERYERDWQQFVADDSLPAPFNSMPVPFV